MRLEQNWYTNGLRWKCLDETAFECSYEKRLGRVTIEEAVEGMYGAYEVEAA